jgi:ketosteroid isomerase-like protein
VLVVAVEHGRGSVSEAEVSARNYMVFTLRAGKILRYQEFYDEAYALEAVNVMKKGPPR